MSTDFDFIADVETGQSFLESDSGHRKISYKSDQIATVGRFDDDPTLAWDDALVPTPARRSIIHSQFTNTYRFYFIFDQYQKATSGVVIIIIWIITHVDKHLSEIFTDRR